MVDKSTLRKNEDVLDKIRQLSTKVKSERKS